MSIGIKAEPIKFFERKGIQFFQEFDASIKYKDKVKVSINPADTFSSIKVKEPDGKELGFYDLEFKKEESTLDGVQLFADVEDRKVGELLTLSALIEFSKNRLNNFKFFSLKESIPFHSRFGFLLDSDDPDYILNGLKAVLKSKVPNISELQYNASFFYPKIKHSEDFIHEDKYLFQRGCKVISDYLKHLSRNKMKEYSPDLVNGSYMKFTDWEFETNRNFLNPLLKEHGIDYQF